VVSLYQPSRRVLIAEDEVAIALELEMQLRDAGFATIGPALDARQASELIASQRIDAAILNIELVKHAIHDVLWPLVASATPIVFMTGHDPSALPDWAPPAQVCLKPCAMTDLLEALERALGTVAAAPVSHHRHERRPREPKRTPSSPENVKMTWNSLSRHMP
jgi:DNA-binding NtrC family response regulator